MKIHQYTVTVTPSPKRLGNSYEQMTERLDTYLDHFLFQHDGKRLEPKFPEKQFKYTFSSHDYDALRELFIEHDRFLRETYKADVKGEYAEVETA
jgi:hypothetical protein